MAIAAEALEAGEAGGAAGAGEGAEGSLSSAAQSAIHSARYGQGTRLSPAVKDELLRHAKGAAKDIKVTHHVRIAGNTLHAVGTTVKAGYAVDKTVADSSSKAAGVRTSGGKYIVRIFVALAVAIVALELASYVSGRYFKVNLGQGAQKLGDVAQYVGLYPTQKSPTTGKPLGMTG